MAAVTIPWKQVENRIKTLRQYLAPSASPQDQEAYGQEVRSILTQSVKSLAKAVGRREKIEVHFAGIDYASLRHPIFVEDVRSSRDYVAGNLKLVYMRTCVTEDSATEALFYHVHGLESIEPFEFSGKFKSTMGLSFQIIYEEDSSPPIPQEGLHEFTLPIPKAERGKLLDIVQVTPGKNGVTKVSFAHKRFRGFRHAFHQTALAFFRHFMAEPELPDSILWCTKGTLCFMKQNHWQPPQCVLFVPVYLWGQNIGAMAFVSQRPFTNKASRWLEHVAVKCLTMLRMEETSLKEQVLNMCCFMPATQARRVVKGDEVPVVTQEDVTILMGDIRKYSEIVGQFERFSETDFFSMALNDFRLRMMSPVFNEGGIVDKFVGDAIMAIFLGHDSCLRALKAGKEMLKQCRRFNRKWRSVWTARKKQEKRRVTRRWRAWAIGIGLSAGKVLIGAFGSKERYEFTVIGGEVNKVARIVDEARGREVFLLDENVRRRISANQEADLGVEIKPLGMFRLKGIGPQDARTRLYVLRGA
jgi:class 3 adenylate cyclase